MGISKMPESPEGQRIANPRYSRLPVCATRTTRFAKLCAAFFFFTAISLLHAHNPDTSYIRIQADADGMEIRFTYDIFTLQRVVPELDANGDHQVTREELTAKQKAVWEFIENHVHLELNQNPVDLGERGAMTWPADIGPAILEKDYHSGAALIHFKFHKPLAEMPEDFAVSFDVFGQLGDRHSVLGSIECDGGKQEVVFNQFEPDYLHDTGFRPSAMRQCKRFLVLGIDHIFLGYDHILFLVALIVVSRFGELIKIVTSFTVAHTITLILSVLQIVQLPSRYVEIGVACTIIYVALENLWVKEVRHRWRLTFFFGLIHGCAFASVLRTLGLPSTGLVRSLLSFNLGVEVGQMILVIALLPLALGLAKWSQGRRVTAAISILISLCGFLWFLERAFGFKVLPI